MAAVAVGAAEGAWPRGICVLHQPDIGQGCGPGREPAGLRALPLVRAAPPGDRARAGDRAVPAGERAVLPLPAAQLSARRLGKQAVDGDRVPGGARGRLRAARAAVAGGHDGAYAGFLGRLPAGARGCRVLAGPVQPAPRQAALPAGGSTLGRAAPGTLSWAAAQGPGPNTIGWEGSTGDRARTDRYHGDVPAYHLRTGGGGDPAAAGADR